MTRPANTMLRIVSGRELNERLLKIVNVLSDGKAVMTYSALRV